MAEAFLAALSERIELWRVDIHPFHKTLLKEWNAAVERPHETEEAEKALVHFAEELYQSVSVEEKTDALYNSLYEKWAAGDQFEKRFVPKLRLCFTIRSKVWQKTKNSVPALMKAPELWEEIFWKKNIPIFLPSPQIS